MASAVLAASASEKPRMDLFFKFIFLLASLDFSNLFCYIVSVKDGMNGAMLRYSRNSHLRATAHQILVFFIF